MIKFSIRKDSSVTSVTGDEITKHEIEVKDGKTVLGRRPQLEPKDNHLIDLEPYDPDGKVSRRHALVIKDGDKILLQDEGSLNGTYLINPVDGSHTKVERERVFPIRIGDTFLTGGVIIKVV